MQRSILSNGLRLLLDPRGPADVAAVYIWVNVGSHDEPAGLEGAAHFVEHMVFKGTRSYGVGEVAAAIEDLGGDLNAFTSFDETVFHATVPAAKAPQAVAVLAEMLREARFDAEELERERLVVLEEIRGGEDDPGMVLAQASWAVAFPGHPYGRPVIGSSASVGAMSRDALLAFYRQHYQPSNACVAVAGPVDVAAVTAAVEASLSGGTVVPPRGARPPTPQGGVYRTLQRGFDATLLELGWAGPPLDHPDLPALDVLCLALGGGASSPIEARLRLQEGLVLDAGLGFDAERHAGMATLYLHPRDGKADAALAAAREELAAARSGGLGRATIERARAQLLSERVFGRETVDGRAHAMVFYQERFGDPGAWRAYDQALLAVDEAAVVRVAQTWLAPEREIGVALVADGQAFSLAAAGEVAPRVARRGQIERFTLENGVRVLLHPDAGEVTAIVATGLGGALADRPSTAGHGQAWARAIARGAGRLGPLDFPAAVESLAGGVGAGWGRSSQFLRGEFIAPNFLPGMELFFDALLAPRFDEAEVDGVRGELLEAYEERDDHAHARLGELLWRLAMGGHPWGLPGTGTRASLAAVTARGLRKQHARWLRGGNLVVSVAGAFDPEVVRRRLERSLATVPSGVMPLAVESPAILPRGRRGSVRAGMEQAHLAMAWPGMSVQDPRQPVLEVLAGLLGGQGGRLFRELREELGLAYDVSAAAHDGVQPGLLVAAMATDPARLAEAEAALLRCVERLRVEGPSEEEVERAKRYLLGAVEHDLQTAAARAQSLAYAELYGLGYDGYVARLRRRIEAVQRDQVAALATERLQGPVAVAVVRPREAE